MASDFDCGYCLDLCAEPVTTPCGHNFCKPCLTTWLLKSRTEFPRRTPQCPYCRGDVEVAPENLQVNRLLESALREITALRLRNIAPVVPEEPIAVLLGRITETEASCQALLVNIGNSIFRRTLVYTESSNTLEVEVAKFWVGRLEKAKQVFAEVLSNKAFLVDFDRENPYPDGGVRHYRKHMLRDLRGDAKKCEELNSLLEMPQPPELPGGGRPIFIASESSKQERVDSILNSMKVTGVILWAVDDVFNDRMEYTCTSFKDLKRLADGMLPIAKKFVAFSESAAVAVALQAFAGNYAAVLRGLKSVWERIQDPPSALPAIKQLVEEANAKLAEAEALGLRFGSM